MLQEFGQFCYQLTFGGSEEFDPKLSKYVQPSFGERLRRVSRRLAFEVPFAFFVGFLLPVLDPSRYHSRLYDGYLILAVQALPFVSLALLVLGRAKWPSYAMAVLWLLFLGGVFPLFVPGIEAR